MPPSSIKEEGTRERLRPLTAALGVVAGVHAVDRGALAAGRVETTVER